MTQPLEVSEAPADVTSLPSLPVRMVQVITAPGALFARLKDRPVWIDAIIVLIALAILHQFAQPESLRTAALNKFLPEGVDPSSIDTSPSVVGTIIGSMFGIPAFTALIAGVLLLTYNAVLGGEGSFRQLFSAATHAQFVTMLGAFVVLGLAFLGSEEMVLSPALLLPDLGGSYAARFLGSIDVFAIWACFVLGTAVHHIYPKRSAVGASIYLLVLYLLLTGVGAALTGLLLGLAASAGG